MHYRLDQQGNKISILGYGCMRLTNTAGKIDIDKAEKEMMAAFHQGVNYFDTAYIYPGSEAALGEILERNQIRDQVYIATKLPHYLIKNRNQLDNYLNEELKRLRTDHIDYYLMHMLTDDATWARLCDLGIKEWIEEKKEKGIIRQVGFSYHGNSDTFMRIVDAYDWNFCQIQYNYLDEDSQAGKTGLHYAHEKGLPVIIMEPLRGGRLVNHLPQGALKHIEPLTPPIFAFRWLWHQPEVTCVLSGMNSLEMVNENCEGASTYDVGCLSDEDQANYAAVVKEINATMKVGCTGCRYCMPCPKNVDIPGTFAAYNRRYSDGKMRGLQDYIMCTVLRKDASGASNCVKCGKCEQHCPQHLHIREELENAKRELEGPIYKIAKKAIKIVMKY